MSPPVAEPASSEDVLSLTLEQEGERLDKALAAQLEDVSRSAIQRLIKEGAITVNGQTSKASYRVEAGDAILVRLPQEEPQEIIPQDIPLHIVYEDASLLAIDKPAGLVVHPAPGHRSGTLVNAVLAHAPEVAEVGPANRPGIVHRLDKETSGLILIAKDSATHQALQQQFRRRQVSKTYLALVEGNVQPPEGIIDAPIGRDPHHRQKMTVIHQGRRARSQYKVIEIFPEQTLLEVYPRTGRTHQVRVHLAWLGYPIVGDTIYGHRNQPLLESRHFLHAAGIRFLHPATDEPMTLEAPLPAELSTVLDQLRRRRR